MSTLERLPGRPKQIRSGLDAVAVVWSVGYRRWVPIGRSKGGTNQQVCVQNERRGEMAVEVALDGGPTFHFIVTNDTNPFIAAADFIQENRLPLFYLDEIAESIEKRRNPTPGIPPIGPNFLNKIGGDALKQLRQFNTNPRCILTDGQFELLAQPTSSEWFRLVLHVVLEWPVSKSWPLIDILRIRILESNARQSIPADGLVQIVNHLYGTSDNFAVLVLARVIGNAFLN
jgi:hypothetical protein